MIRERPRRSLTQAEVRESEGPYPYRSLTHHVVRAFEGPYPYRWLTDPVVCALAARALTDLRRAHRSNSTTTGTWSLRAHHHSPPSASHWWVTRADSGTST